MYFVEVIFKPISCKIQSFLTTSERNTKYVNSKYLLNLLKLPPKKKKKTHLNSKNLFIKYSVQNRYCPHNVTRHLIK